MYVLYTHIYDWVEPENHKMPCNKNTTLFYFPDILCISFLRI